MKKLTKRLLGGITLAIAAIALSGCTKSFCTTEDTAVNYNDYVHDFYDVSTGTYTDEMQKNVINGASKYMIPSSAYWIYLDSKVDSTLDTIETAIKNDLNGATDLTNQEIAERAQKFVFADTQRYITASYVRSYYETYAYFTEHNPSVDISKTDDAETKAKIDEIEKSDAYYSTRVNRTTVKALIRYAGVDDNGNAVLWGNFDKWNKIAAKSTVYSSDVPTAAFSNYFKSVFSNHIGRYVTCITPTSGYFGTSERIYISGKTWGQAFSQYGFLEGLLVYPIGWLVYTFANAFGATGTNAGGQILAIFLTTLIVRLIIVLMQVGSQSSQTKMTEIQPQIDALRAKYPNAETSQAEQQKLSQETMAIYKKNKIHPFRSIIILIIQFPIFICVWSALQGSAILTRGSVFGLHLTTLTQAAMTSNSSETPFAIILFVMMAVAQFFSSLLPGWMQSWHKAHAVGSTVKVQEKEGGTASFMKWMPIIMMIFVIIMGLQLPAAMAIYWFFGALISIVQTIITEIVNTLRRNKKKGKSNDFKGGDHFNKHGAYKSQSAPHQKHMKLR